MGYINESSIVWDHLLQTVENLELVAGIKGLHSAEGRASSIHMNCNQEM